MFDGGNCGGPAAMKRSPTGSNSTAQLYAVFLPLAGQSFLMGCRLRDDSWPCSSLADTGNMSNASIALLLERLT
jgi:hypothetical protein